MGAFGVDTSYPTTSGMDAPVHYGPTTHHKHWPGWHGGQTFHYWEGDSVPGMRDQPAWDKIQLGAGKRKSLVDDIPATLGGRIIKARGYRGWTMEQFARAVKTHVASIKNWETDKHHPSNQSLYRIQKALGVNHQWLVEGKGKMIG